MATTEGRRRRHLPAEATAMQRQQFVRQQLHVRSGPIAVYSVPVTCAGNFCAVAGLWQQAVLPCGRLLRCRRDR